MERKRILFLPSWYPSRVNPTNGNFIRRYAEVISSFADVDVLFAVSDKTVRKFELTQSSGEKETLNETIIYYPKISIPFLSGLFKLWRYLRMYSLGYREICNRKQKPDLVHVQVTFPAGLFALWLKRKKGIPYIVTEHWSGYYPEDGSYRGLLIKYFTRKIIRNASRVTTVSSSLAKEMQRHSLNNSYSVIPNAVDTDIFKPSANLLLNENKQFIHISGLTPEKNMEGILQAVTELSKQRNDFHLLIVCDSENKRKYIQLADKLQLLGTYVYFTGRKYPDEIAALLNQSTALVMFSRFETMSIVMAEAWACGKPVISTRVGGVTEYMDDSRGWLVESENVSRLVYAMNRMLDHCKDFNKDEIRRFAVENFSSATITAKFESLYEIVHS